MVRVPQATGKRGADTDAFGVCSRLTTAQKHFTVEQLYALVCRAHVAGVSAQALALVEYSRRCTDNVVVMVHARLLAHTHIPTRADVSTVHSH
jgi:hypothetical protein